MISIRGRIKELELKKTHTHTHNLLFSTAIYVRFQLDKNDFFSKHLLGKRSMNKNSIYYSYYFS